MSKIDTGNFQHQLLNLEPIEFIGVARILNVPVVREDNEIIPFEEVYSSLLSKYETLSRRQRRNLDKLLRAATSKAKVKK